MKEKIKAFWNNKKKRSITVLALIWLVIFGVAGTFAWFTSRVHDDTPVQMGSACRMYATNTFNEQTVMPGDTIEGEISFRSISTRGSFVRVNISVANAEDFFIGDDTFDDIFEMDINSNLRRHGNWY